MSMQYVAGRFQVSKSVAFLPKPLFDLQYTKLVLHFSLLVSSAMQKEGNEFHTPDRHRRYFAALVNDMRVRTIRVRVLITRRASTQKTSTIIVTSRVF